LRSRHFRTAQEFQDTIREGGGASTAPGKGEDNEVVFVFFLQISSFESIAGTGIDLRDSRIDGPRRAPGNREKCKKNDPPLSTTAPRICDRRLNRH